MVKKNMDLEDHVQRYMGTNLAPLLIVWLY